LTATVEGIEEIPLPKELKHMGVNKLKCLSHLFLRTIKDKGREGTKRGGGCIRKQRKKKIYLTAKDWQSKHWALAGISLTACLCWAKRKRKVEMKKRSQMVEPVEGCKSNDRD